MTLKLVFGEIKTYIIHFYNIHYLKLYRSERILLDQTFADLGVILILVSTSQNLECITDTQFRSAQPMLNENLKMLET